MREASFREQLSKWLEEKKVMRLELLQAKEQVPAFISLIVTTLTLFIDHNCV